MTEPRTHYQVSFTSRQAVLLFVVVLAALTGAYFLGLVTGLAGRQPAGGAGVAAVSASAAVPTAAAAAETVSPPVTVPTAAQETPPPAVAAREPAKTEGLQFFEDRPAEPTPVSPGPSRKATQAKAAGGFWVQILSTKSEREAKSRRAVLSGHGYRAMVESARGAGGPALYRVRVGPFSSREEALKAAQALERKEKAKTWIVPPGE